MPVQRHKHRNLQIRSRGKRTNKTMTKKIIVNGTFDILHTGHIKLLNYAKSLGDHLVVAIDADERVKQLKGFSRPINNAQERKLLLENLKSVDEVKVFNTDSQLLSVIVECDIMVKGSDYKGKPIIGENLINVVFFDYIDGYSTTSKIQDITSR